MIKGGVGDVTTGYGVYINDYHDNLTIDGAMTIWGRGGTGSNARGIFVNGSNLSNCNWLF